VTPSISEFETRGRQTSKTRELINHCFQTSDFAGDRVRALADHRGNALVIHAVTIRAVAVRRHTRVALRDPFSGELNWRQRILDLVGHATRDFAPRRRALRRKQLRKVFDHKHSTASRTDGVTQSRRGDRNRYRAAAIRAAFELRLFGGVTGATRAAQ
jgi:hypothetical protein